MHKMNQKDIHMYKHACELMTMFDFFILITKIDLQNANILKLESKLGTSDYVTVCIYVCLKVYQPITKL